MAKFSGKYKDAPGSSLTAKTVDTANRAFLVLHQPRILFITAPYENINKIREILEWLHSQL
ncbi:MAG: hypothetical protein ACI9WC_003726 [Arenicella sp.]|jgi:hypothetical protein